MRNTKGPRDPTFGRAKVERKKKVEELCRAVT